LSIVTQSKTIKIHQQHSAKHMFSGRDIRKFLAEMRQEQRRALQLGTCAMVLLPTIFITTLM